MGDLSKKYNMKSPAVKRLMREAAELREPTDQYYAQPLDDNLFEWHFTVRGPPDTEFDDGRYHGRITLPPEYPMKPPSIILLTPNGRFEIGKKICLSMSAHHPETWQPSWSIRTVMLALIGFMPTPGGGAIGALDHSPDERKVMAKRSRTWKCEACGNDNGDCLLERDLSKEKEEVEEIKELAAQINFKGEDKNKSTSSLNSPTSPQPATGVSTLSPVTQQQLQQMQQMYNMNNPLFNNQQQSFSTTTATATTVTTTTAASPKTDQLRQPTVPDNTSGDTTLRQRTTHQSTTEEASIRDFDTTFGQPSVNNESSRAETVSFYLVWIVLIPLVILILRRLGMENGGFK